MTTENRCVNNLELIGNLALGLVRQLPQTYSYDTQVEIRERINKAWERCRERLGMLTQTAEAVLTLGGSNHVG